MIYISVLISDSEEWMKDSISNHWSLAQGSYGGQDLAQHLQDVGQPWKHWSVIGFVRFKGT